MKLTESRIKEIILEEIQAIAEEEEKERKLGDVKTGRAQRAQKLKGDAAAITKQTGIDPKEYGIMQQFEDLLSNLADLTDIKTGKTMAVLNPMFKKLKAIQQELKQALDKQAK